MTKDMTVGKPLRLLISFSIPLLLGTIFQQLYNLVDTVIVGQYLGITALSSVGATSSINYLIIGFCTGICSGFSIPVAQQFGAKKYDRMRRFIMNGAYLAAAFSVIIAVATVYLCRDILVIMRTPDEILEGSYAYLVIIFAGIPFTVLYNMVAGIIRAMGDSKTPFYFLVVAAFLNVGLDLLFIIQFGMGVAGAAYATVISQAVSGITCLIYMRKKFEILETLPEERRINGAVLWELVKTGVPMGLLSSITAIGTVMVQSAVNSLGIVYVSAYTAVSKIKQFTINPYVALDTAVATYTSQNYGAKKIDRVYQGLKASLFIFAVYSVMIAIVLTFAGDKIALIFVDGTETEVLGYVKLFFQCCGPFYLLVIFLDCFRSVIQGLGYSYASLLAGISELIARAILALAVIPTFGYIGVCFTDAAAWVAAGACVMIMFYCIMKSIKKKYAAA